MQQIQHATRSNLAWCYVSWMSVFECVWWQISCCRLSLRHDTYECNGYWLYISMDTTKRPSKQSVSQCTIYHTSPSCWRTLLPCIACLVWQNIGGEDQGLPSRSLASPGRARREEPRRTDKPTRTGNELDGLIAKETRARRKARRTTGHYNSQKKCSGHVHRSDLMPKGNLSP